MNLRRALLTLSLGLLAAATTTASMPSHALVSIPVASLRAEPRHSAELETQSLMGTPLTLSAQEGEWLRATTPDGYEAWVPESAVTPLDSTEMDRWRHSPRSIVMDVRPMPVLADTLKGYDPRNIVSDITFLSIVEATPSTSSLWTAVTLPDGRTGHMPSASLMSLDDWANQTPSAKAIVETAYSLMGVPYLWGGTSAKAIDCSGLTQLCYFSQGLLLPRNASAQARLDARVDIDHPETFETADLLFFANPQGRIVHVALMDRGTHYIHASGRVFESSFDPADTLYQPRPVVSATRPLSLDSLKVKFNHWYF